MKDVLLQRDGPLATVTLNRPGCLNAIGGNLTRDLYEALVTAGADPAVRVIILTGAGRAFCAGDDLRESAQLHGDRAAVTRHIEAIQQVSRALLLGPKPVVAAAGGYAVGGGFEWMLDCDLAIAAEDLVAFLPESRWGYFVTGGLTHLLPQIVGRQRALELALLGERVGANRLHQLGLVNRVVPAARLAEEARDVALRIAGMSPYSIQALRRAMTTGPVTALTAVLDVETRITIESFLQPDTAARVQAFAARDPGRH